MAFRTNKMPVLQNKSASGAIASFNTILTKPLVSGEFSVNAVQAGSGTPSPSNPRSISGWSAINIGAVGDNVWDETTKQGYYHTSGGYYVNVPGQLCSNTFIAVKPETTYRFVKPNTQGDVLYYDNSKTYLNQYRASVPKNGTFTTPSGCYYITINLGNNYGATYNNNVIIAYPSGTYITIQIGSTCYGGTYDAETGLFTVTHEGVDLGSLTYSIVGGTFLAQNQIAQSSNINLSDAGNNVISEIYTPCATWGRFNNYEIGVYQNQVRIMNNDYTDANVFKTAMSGKKLVYKLLTPTTIQLSGTQIETLNGVNNIFCDTGDTSVVFNDLDIAKRGSFREVFKLPS